MKFTSAVVGLLALSSGVLAKDDKKSKKKDEKEEPAPPVCPAPREVSIPKVIRPFEVVDLKHYLVGLLKFPAATIPPKLDKHTSGRKALPAPLGYVPNVGITHIEGLVDKTVVSDSKTGAKLFEFYKKKKGAFVVLKDEGYKSSDNSDDFALHYHLIQIQKPFVYNNGEATFKDEIYTPVILDDTLLISDPDKLIKWKSEWDGQNIDIQVAYGAPANWQDWKADRVLTGRDLSPEGIAVKTDACAVIAEKWGPSVFSIDIPTGKVTSPLVPVPDIWYNETHKYMYDDLFLSTTSDKRHCYLHEAQMNMCGSVPSSRVDSNGYFAYVADEDEDEDDKKKNKDKVKVFVPKFTRIPSDAGWAGLTLFPSGTAVGMFQQTLSGEPGPRIYEVDPGDCTSACPPKVKKFLGFYQLSHNANRIAAITAIAGSSDFVYTTEPGTVNPEAYGSNTRLLVKEHSSGFPDGDRFSPNHTGGMPADKLCIIWIDLDVVVQDDKICILNYMHIADPYDVDHNGLGVYAQSSFYNSGLVVTDDYCFIGGTDPDWPVDFDKFGLEEVAASVPFYTEAVEDTRFFIVCFYEPYFDEGYNWASQGVFFNDIRL